MNQFSQFKVGYNSSGIKSNYKIEDKVFVTGKGIKLGITEFELVELLGHPITKETKDGLTKYSYKQINGLYFGQYWFNRGKLEKFWFGEEYP